MVIQAQTPHHDQLTFHFDDEGLLGGRTATEYNATEQEYSLLLYRRIEQLLKGERNDLLILRKYPEQAERLGAMPTPASLNRASLRLDRVERMATDALIFLSAHSPGGPVAQFVDTEGRLVETRKFPTRYPHIIIERVDVYSDAEPAHPLYVQWHARRLQNHRRSIRLNNMLDLLGLGVEAAKLFIR